MRQEIKLLIDTRILDKAREVIKQSERKNVEIDDIIEKWCFMALLIEKGFAKDEESWEDIDARICRLMDQEIQNKKG
jgi:hypothetical protein